MFAKYFKPLIFAVMTLVTVTQSAAKDRGGDTRGGGFLPEEGRAGYWQVKQLFDYESDYKNVLKATFTRIEDGEINVGADLPELQNIINTSDLYRALFFPPSGPNVYELIKNLKVMVKENEGCPTIGHTIADSSYWISYAADGTKIYNACLSYHLMKEKLFISNYQRAAYSMVSHEIVHLIGRSHEEAVVIDHEVRGRDWLGPASGALVLNARNYFSDDSGNWSRLANSQYEIRNGQVDKLKLCMALAVMDEGYEHLGLGFSFGIMAPIYRYEQKVLGSIIFGKVVNLMGLCYENHPNDVFGKNPKLPDKISMRKYFKIFSPNTAFPSRQYETATSTRIMGADFDKHLFRHEAAIDYSALGSDYDRYFIRPLIRGGVLDPKAIESELKDIYAITKKIRDYLIEY